MDWQSFDADFSSTISLIVSRHYAGEVFAYSQLFAIVKWSDDVTSLSLIVARAAEVT